MLSPAFILFLQASTGSAAPPAHPPTRAQIQQMDKHLRAMGLPPGLESWTIASSRIREVTLAPIFHQPFACSEHPLGQLDRAGDALGTDCMIVAGTAGDDGFERMYRTDGRDNADWYGWQAAVRAPIDGVVRYVHVNPTVNIPGKMGKPPASMIEIARADGVRIVVAHVADPRVRVGDSVRRGAIIALVGNNGMARNPHIHIGAFKGRQPLQIRWDLRAMGDVPTLRGDE